MNCQEFRDNWIQGNDEATHSHIESHIETCDDCLLWIEAYSLRDEEVTYLKEFPQPSPQLEERIMQAIYETARTAVMPPHLAAQQDVTIEKRSFTRPRKFFSASTVWIGAAAAIFAIGLITWPQVNQQLEQQAAPLASVRNLPAQQSASNDASPAPNESTTAPAASPEMGTAMAPPETNAAVPNTTAPSETPVEAPANSQPLLKQPQALSSNSVAKTDMSSRSKQIQQNTPASDSAQAKKAPPATTTEPESKVPMFALAPLNPEGAKIDPNQSPQTIAPDEPQTPDSTPADLLDGEFNTLSSTSLSDTAANVTVSTFTEIETAVQASDLPIPALGQSSNGYRLDSLSLRYESQTSKHVIGLSGVYTNGSNQVAIEVNPVVGERSLSIPGTFADRKLFTIDGNQAIAVTYKLDPTSSANEHAVHFMTSENNTQLYVILSGHGGSLDQLIDLAKGITWKK
ncbi:hypothetical protein [Brevibacillus sp. SYSU BS000544]|uniref:hypothetical protein n=1 Tax=Brevibacillus sp. SYSU BS000544 TaxID=3416443 RepID=UPI003CE5AB4B